MISIVIPTCNRNDLLAKCLNCLSPTVQTIEDIYEVIVTDDSKDNLAKVLIESTYSWVKWIEGPKKGPAANRNNGAKMATGNWLVFIDDDVIPNQTLLENYRLLINDNPNEFAFEGKIVPNDWDLIKRDLADCPINIHGGNFWSANVCIERYTFLAIKGFDTDYLIAAQEDQQIKIDLEKYTNRKIFFAEECVVTHPVRFLNLKDELFKIPKKVKNYTIYAKKNKELLKFTSVFVFAKSQYFFLLRTAYRNLRNYKYKSFVITVFFLLWGIPLGVYYFSKNN